MALTLTIAGVPKELQRGSLRISQTANGRATASFRVLSADGTYRPAQDAEVVLQEDGTTIFGGLVDKPKERGAFDGAPNAAIVTSVSAFDYHAYPERRFVNETLAAGTLKSQLTTLRTTYLAVYGVTLHASQVDGPSMPELAYDYRRLDEVLNELATLTADAGEPYVWRIDASKVLRMYQPSTSAAPFNISGNTPSQVIGDIVVESDRDHYANRVIVKVPPKSQANRQEAFTGDGTTGPFQLVYTPTKLYGHILLGSPPGTEGAETLGIPPDSPITWSYDSLTNTIERTAGATTIGVVYTLEFDGVFSGVWTAEDGTAATNPKEIVVTVDSIPSETTGQAIADAELAKRLVAAKRVSYRTQEAGLAPGQTQTITVPRRDLSVTAVISDINIRDFGKNRLDRTVTAVVDAAQTNLGRGFRDDLKTWYGDKAGGSAPATVSAGAGTATVSGGPAVPFKSVQFNRDGVFGGDDAFIYYEDENSLVCGDGNAITAAEFAHCHIFGSNCTIADPA